MYGMLYINKIYSINLLFLISGFSWFEAGENIFKADILHYLVLTDSPINIILTDTYTMSYIQSFFFRKLSTWWNPHLKVCHIKSGHRIISRCQIFVSCQYKTNVASKIFFYKYCKTWEGACIQLIPPFVIKR